MPKPATSPPSPPRIERLHVENYRALQDVTLENLSGLTVLLGPNGSGKSTVFDVFAFLSEAFSAGLRKAWDKRGRFKELRTRDSEGPIIFELKYREPGFPLITYRLEVDEDSKGPFVAREWLRWTRKPGRGGRPFYFLDFSDGEGFAISGDEPDLTGERSDQKLASRDLLAINTLGQLASHPRVGALRRFITGWYLSYLTADSTRGVPEAGPQERLSQTGDNLPNVVQYLKEQHQDRLNEILSILAARVPRMEKVDAEILGDGRLMLQVKDAPFSRPVLSKWASDGTLKMLAYLVMLHDPEPAPLIGVEEPENHIHPRILRELGEECRAASEHAQLVVTTHSPQFLDAFRADEVWLLGRDPSGHTRATKASLVERVPQFLEAGATLGQLWLEGYLSGASPDGASEIADKGLTP